MKRFFLALSLILNVNMASAMLIRATPGTALTVTITAVGPILPGDLARLRTAYQDGVRKASKPPTSAIEQLLMINSEGGDLKEAMAIGRWIRENKLAVVVPPQGNCYSSCVNILAAGVLRFVGGEVGIHRPYLVRQPSASFDVVMKKALSDSQAFFTQMNVPVQLADAMFSIPPEKLEVLDEAKLSFYRLNQADFAYSEEQEMSRAARYGMSRQEYLVKWSKYEEDIKACDSLKGGDYVAYYTCTQKYLVRYGFRKPTSK